MSSSGIEGAKRRGKPWRTTTPDPAGSDAPDLAERDFTAVAPDRLWVVDFTYPRTWEGVVHFRYAGGAHARSPHHGPARDPLGLLAKRSPRARRCR